VTPDTVHLIALLIRHRRGECTAIEKWLEKQPENDTVQELRDATRTYRDVLDLVEGRLIAMDAVPQPSRRPALRAEMASTGSLS
jgi:hypothetical protein